jgi:Dipeptidyl peptidase IV (DPP IV) N-terminal region
MNSGGPVKHTLRSMLFLVLPTWLYGQVKHKPTLDEMLSLKTISSPKISPDGQFVAYQVRETNWKEDAYVSQVWLMNVTTANSFQLTRGEKSADQVEWSPDGHWLAFVTERESNAIELAPVDKKEPTAEKPAREDTQGKPKEERKDADQGPAKPAEHQIWLISPYGGEAWQLTKSETDVDSFTGRKIVSGLPSRHIRPRLKLERIVKNNTATTKCLRRIMNSNSYGWWTWVRQYKVAYPQLRRYSPIQRLWSTHLFRRRIPLRSPLAPQRIRSWRSAASKISTPCRTSWRLRDRMVHWHSHPMVSNLRFLPRWHSPIITTRPDTSRWWI